MFSPQRIPQQHPTSPGASRPPPVVPLVSAEGEDQRTAHHAATPSSCRTTGKSDHPFSSSHQKPARCLILGQPRVSLTHTSCSCAPGAALLQSMQEAARSLTVKRSPPPSSAYSSSAKRGRTTIYHPPQEVEQKTTIQCQALAIPSAKKKKKRNSMHFQHFLLMH